MKTFSVVHNIPSPYRLHLFRMLNVELKERGLNLHVHFMASGYQERPHWCSTSSICCSPDSVAKYGFSHSFWHDRGWEFGPHHLHYNPELIAHLISNPVDYLLVGGPWATITAMAISLKPRARRSIAWLEANTKTPGRINGIAGAFKRKTLSKYDYIAVPGQEGIAHAQLIFGTGKPPPLVLLPNLVDEKEFRKNNYRQESRTQICKKYDLPENRKIALWNARLIASKGICEFLSKISVGMLAGWNIIILGDGPEKNKILKTIHKNRLQDHVFVFGYVSYDKMPEIYNAADFLILASLRDPNPLSVIEAMHCGLPLLVSNRIGNFSEALEEGENGWCFDPFDQRSVVVAVKKAFSASRQELGKMGEKSRKIASRHWSSNEAINRFLDSVL